MCQSPAIISQFTICAHAGMQIKPYCLWVSNCPLYDLVAVSKYSDLVIYSFISVHITQFLRFLLNKSFWLKMKVHPYQFIILTIFGVSVTQLVYINSIIAVKISGDMSVRTNGTLAFCAPSPFCAWSLNIALNTAHRVDRMHLWAYIGFLFGPIRNLMSL